VGFELPPCSLLLPDEPPMSWAVCPMSACCLKTRLLAPCLCHHVFMHDLENASSDARSELCKVLGKALEPRSGLTWCPVSVSGL